jgi:hypothetical protein
MCLLAYGKDHVSILYIDDLLGQGDIIKNIKMLLSTP